MCIWSEHQCRFLLLLPHFLRYYIRAAAMARRVYLRSGIGVGAFKRIFGGRKMRGTRPEKFMTGSGSICRHILKELESLKIIEKVPNSKGRRITPQGQRDLDSIAGQIQK